MNIRLAETKDLPKILEMNEDSVPHVSSVELSDMKRFLKQANPFLVVEEEDELAGFMIVLQKGLDYKSLNYRFFCTNYENFDYVDRIVIKDKFRDKKLGTALYNHLEEQYSAEMITCEINIKPPNEKSMGFHKSLGFSKVAEQETGGGKKSVAMMVKRL
jgi:predicted GNAT superfamily acetyltransferase